ncbi:hypothetical protein [Streptomyces sp. NPDC058694]|uniref:hypothetical protein n=1 Tax=Streptomyces sp. NPDC058694 TaxID=3346603 RepID=UPI00365D900F
MSLEVGGWVTSFRLQMSHAPNFAYELCQRKIKDEQVAGLDLSCWEYAGNGVGLENVIDVVDDGVRPGDHIR